MPRSFKTLWGIFSYEDCGGNFVAGIGVDNLSDWGCVEGSSGGCGKQVETTPTIGRVLAGEPHLFSAPDNMKMFLKLGGSRTGFYRVWNAGA